MRILFEKHSPDIAPEVLGSQGLTSVETALKAPAGYVPLPTLQTADGPTTGITLGAGVDEVRAAMYCMGSGWVNANYAVTNTNVYWSYGTGAWTSITGAYPGTTNNEVVNCCQFGDAFIFVYGLVDGSTAIPQRSNVTTHSACADLSATTPEASYVMAVGQHVVLGDFWDGTYGIGQANNGVWWSAIGNHTSWPDPTSAAGIAAQSGYIELSGSGGPITALVSDGDVGHIFQQTAIWRMDYVGGAVMFEIDNVVTGKGAVTPNMAAKTPIGIVFIDRSGWNLYDGQSTRPIGGQAFNKSFMEDEFTTRWNNLQRYDRWSLVADPESSRVYCHYAKGAGSGDNNRLAIWDWQRDEIVYDDVAASKVVTLLSDPDDAAAGVAPKIGIFNGADPERFQCWDGVAQLATFITGDIEPNPGGRATFTSAKPLVQGVGATVKLYVSARDDLGDAVTYGSAKTVNSWDRFDGEEDARYFRFKLTCESTWTACTGMDADFAPSGRV